MSDEKPHIDDEYDYMLNDGKEYICTIRIIAITDHQNARTYCKGIVIETVAPTSFPIGYIVDCIIWSGTKILFKRSSSNMYDRLERILTQP